MTNELCHQVLLQISVLTHTGKFGFHYLEKGAALFSLSARSLVGMFQAAVASPPTIAATAAAAPGFGHVQLHVPRDLRDDCQPYLTENTLNQIRNQAVRHIFISLTSSMGIPNSIRI